MLPRAVSVQHPSRFAVEHEVPTVPGHVAEPVLAFRIAHSKLELIKQVSPAENGRPPSVPGEVPVSLDPKSG